MRVNISKSAAERMTEILRNLIKGDNVDKDLIMDFLKNDDGCKVQFKFYGNNFTIEEYADMFIKSVKDEKYKTDSEILGRMNNALMRISKNMDLLDKKIRNIKEYDLEILEGKLKDTLPEDTQLNFNIFFCLDGYNAGSIVDKNTMCLDALFWASDKAKEEQIEGIILHEFHHIGCLYWLNKNERRNYLLSRKDNNSLAISLIESIMGEGAAVYFFNESEDLYELIKEAYGIDVGNSSEEKYLNSWNGMDKKLESLKELLVQLLTEPNTEYKRLKAVVNQCSYSKDNEEALDKVIGKYMCMAIDSNLGRERLLECFKEPKKFLNYYNEACDKENKEGLDSRIISMWNSIW